MRGSRRGRIVALAVLAFALAFVACGCAPDESGLAARYDGGQVTEGEVNAYTEQFRNDSGFADDDTWAQYLFEQDLTAASWRQRAIGAIVEERLIAEEAEKQGVQPDGEAIEAQMAHDRAAAGIDADDGDAWTAYLESMGLDEERYRADLEAASVESRLLAANIGLDPESDGDVLDAYIRDKDNYLLSRVVRRYRVLCYDTEQAAQAALDELSALSGEELAARFDELVVQDDSDDTTPENGGDIGWDIATDLGQVQEELNSELVGAGAVSALVHDLDGKYYVMLCTDRYVFTSESAYGQLPDDDLKSYVLQLATYAKWNQMEQDYIAGLREAAHVQYRDATRALPYDVDGKIAALKAQVGR